MTDNLFHATLIALFVALAGSSAESYRDSMLAADRLAARRAEACRAAAPAEPAAAPDSDRRACS